MSDTKPSRPMILARTCVLALGVGIAFVGFSRLGSAVPNAPQEDVPLFQAPAPPEPGDVMMLQLRNGQIQWGAIEDHTPERIDFVRLDNSGAVTLPWSLLDPVQAGDLRTKFGYVSIEVEEALVEGERLVLEGGGTMEGVIVSREGDHYVIKTDGNLVTLPKIRVRNIEKGVQLNALDVYSRDEIYGIYAAETDFESAESVLELAEKCESILDFRHAAEHYGAALALGLEEDQATKIQGALAAAEIKAENQEQLDLLRGADQLRKRGRFDEALAILRAFPEQFEGSPLVEDSRKAEQKMLLARDAAAADYTRRRWYYWAQRLTREKARRGGFEECRTWAIEGASEEIQIKIHEELVEKVSEEIALEDVRTLWEARRKRSYIAATYGSSGTWLLGRDKANEGAAEDEGPAAGPVSAVDAERQALEERIKRYVENQRVTQRSRNSEDADDERETFWASWSASGRAQWLHSYYAEESGDFEVRPRPYLKACQTCGGRGGVELLVTGTVLRGESASLAECPLCHGVQVVRRVYFR